MTRFVFYIYGMKYFPFLLLPFLLLSSCGDSSRKTTKDSARILTGDTVVVTGGDSLHPDTAVVLFRFDKHLSLSEESKKTESLPAKDVRKRFWPLDEACNEDARDVLQRFFALDSLKKKDWDANDIGQTVEVIVRVVDTVKVPGNYYAVAWIMYRESYPACPFSYGTYYMLTTYTKNGARISTQLLGLNEGAADAPVTFSADETAELFRDGSFKGVHADTSDCGEDDPKPADCVEIRHYTYQGHITADGHILRTDEKQ